MRIDSHVYCLPPRLHDGNKLPQVERQVLDAIHNHPEGPYALSLSSPEAILISMEQCGLDQALLVAFPWQSADLCRETNDYLLNLAVKQEQFHCLCSVQPKDTNHLHEAERCLNAGALGFKVNPVWQDYEMDGPVMDELCAFASGAGATIMTHVDQGYKKSAASVSAFLELAKRHPKTKFLASHLGGGLGLYSQHKPIKEAISNVWFDTAVSSTMNLVKFYVESGLENKIVFGTDFPFNHCHNQNDPLDDLLNLGFSQIVREKILFKNFMALFGCENLSEENR